MTPLDPRIHQALEGEVSRDALPTELRHEVEALERAAGQLRAAPPLPSVAARVLSEIRRPRPSPARRIGRWLAAPLALTLQVRPVWTLAVVAILAAVLLTGREPGPVLGAEEGIADFVGRFPGARSVEVVGSFNDWRPGATVLRDDNHDGVWRAALVLPSGQHQYMFVVDGERWVTDPLAGRYVDDGYGSQNAVLIVRPERGGGRR